MQWYYSKTSDDNRLILNGDEAHHCKNVMRHKPGDELIITDGAGKCWEGVVEHFKKEEVYVRVDKETFIPHRQNELHIAISPTKSIDRFEWFLEKATEMGIERITPLLTHRTERSRLNYERLNKVLISAMKQSQQVWLPCLDNAMDFNDLIENTDKDFLRLICHAQNATPLKTLIKDKLQIAVLIGPEGDFTKEELEIAIKKGFVITSLGKNRLRTETAGMAVCAAINMYNS